MTSMDRRATTTFEHFYADHRDRLVRLLAMELADVHLAADAVDVAMSRAWQRWDRLDDHADAGAWVYRVARNWATSWYRRRRRHGAVAVPDVAVRDTHPSDHAHALAALDTIPSTQRGVVVLRVLGGFSTAATAAALGVPEGTVKSRLARGLARLRDALGDER